MARNARAEAMASQASPTGAPAAPALHVGLQTLAEAWVGEARGLARQLAEGRAACGAAAPDLIHGLRVGMRRFCALSDLLPRQERGRALLRKEVGWAMEPLSRARDWDVFIGETLPRLCDEEPDLDRTVSLKRAAARSLVEHGEMYAHVQSDRFQGVLQLFWDRHADMRAAMSTRSSKALFGRLRNRLDGWDEKVRGRLADKTSMRDAHIRHQLRMDIKRLRYASEGLLNMCPSRKLKRYVRSLGALQGALGDVQDLAMATRLASEVCISLSSGRLARRKSAKACGRMRLAAEARLRGARRKFLRDPAFWANAGQGKFARRIFPAEEAS